MIAHTHTHTYKEIPPKFVPQNLRNLYMYMWKPCTSEVCTDGPIHPDCTTQCSYISVCEYIRIHVHIHIHIHMCMCKFVVMYMFSCLYRCTNAFAATYQCMLTSVPNIAFTDDCFGAVMPKVVVCVCACVCNLGNLHNKATATHCNMNPAHCNTLHVRGRILCVWACEYICRLHITNRL